MGSAQKLSGPKVKTVFVEDMDPEEAAKVAPESYRTLDVYEFCSERVKKVLKIARDAALKEEEDAILAKKLKGEEDASMTDMNATLEKEIDPELKAAMAMSMAENGEDEFIGKEFPLKFQGKYEELFAVVTHKGRDADGGHYMGWVKAEDQGDAAKIGDSEEDNADWFVFDDDARFHPVKLKMYSS